MTLLAIWSWTTYVESSVGGGYVVALALLCLAHYIWKTMGERLRMSNMRGELSSLEAELNAMQNASSTSRIENDLLRQLLTESDPEQALQQLFQHLVRSDTASWALYVDLDPTARVRAQRGLKGALVGEIQPDAGMLRRITEHEFSQLCGPSLLDCAWLRQLSSADRDALHTVYVIRVGTAEVPQGVLLMTHLFPQKAALAQQRELLLRIVPALADMLARADEHTNREEALRQTHERLAIRSILNVNYNTSIEMAQAFVQRLQQELLAERAALFVTRGDRNLANTPFVSSGISFPAGIRETWLRYESNLASLGLTRRQAEPFDDKRLARYNILSLIGSALVVPVYRGNKVFGVLCFTRRDHTPFELIQQETAEWGAGLLAEKMSRLLQQVQVEREARQDGLTQLNNRRTFDQEFNRELHIAHATCGELSLIMIDIDRFKSVNDTYGHLGGDHVLRTVSSLITEITSHLRSGDRAICARYGGEELAILFPGMGIAGAQRNAELIRQRLEQTMMQFDGRSFQVTLSAGVASSPLHGTTPEELISAADEALYKAKQSGRNQVQCAPVATPVMTRLDAPLPQQEAAAPRNGVPQAACPTA